MPPSPTSAPALGLPHNVKTKLNQPITLSVMVGVFLATQLGITFWAAGFIFEQWVAGFAIWDSNWYTLIATEGYVDARSFAFLPLWPALLRAMADLTSLALPLAGLTLSLGFYLASLYLLAAKNDGLNSGGLPLLRAGHVLHLLPIVFAPGAWVYASNHTEALFLFLSVLAFQKAYKGQLVVASVTVGIAALTRNQGVFAAIAIGSYFLLNPVAGKGHRLRQFATSGLISAGLFALWPLYQYLTTGTPFASLSAQSYWEPISSFKEYLDNMLWVSVNSLPRVLWFWGILGTGIALMVRKKERGKTLPIGLYLVLSVIIWPTQGYKAPNGLRYGAVIFPFWLLCGQAMTALLFNSLAGWRGAARRVLGFTLAGYLITGMILATSHYLFQGSWPY